MKLVDPDAARDRAREIVDGFEPKDPPRPFRGLLDWIGDRLEPVVRPFRDAIAWLFDVFPAPLAWLVLAAVVGLIVAGLLHLVAGSMRNRAERRARGGADHPSDALDPRGPEELELAAAEAAANGDYERALRLRFRAGLLRLDRDAGAIVYHDGIGTADVRAQVEVPALDELSDRFDRVAYGRAPAASSDDDHARRAWPEIVRSARR